MITQTQRLFNIEQVARKKYSLTLASGIDTAKSVSTVKNWKPSSGASLNHVYTAATYKPWFVLDDNRKKITRHAATGGEKFSVTADESISTGAITVDSLNVTVGENSLPKTNQKSITLTGAAYKFSLASGISDSLSTKAAIYDNTQDKFTAKTWNAYYKSEDITDGKNSLTTLRSAAKFLISTA